MGKYFLKIYSKLIGSKILVKLILSYFLIVLITMAITGQFIINNLLNRKHHEEVEMQKREIVKIDDYLTRMYENAEDRMIELYSIYDNKNSISNILSSFDNQDYEGLDLSNSENYSTTIYRIPLMDKDVLDFILLNKENKAIYANSYKADRSISPSYDFDKNAIIKGIDDETFEMFLSLNSEYVIGNERTFITYAGNILEENQLINKVSVGKYIINVSTDGLIKQYNENKIYPDSILLVYDDDGKVWVSNDEGYTGQIISVNKEEEIEVNNTKIATTDDSIMNTSYLKKMKLNIAIITYKANIDKEIYELIRKIYLIIISGIIISTIFTLFVSRLFTKRVELLTSSMKDVEKGNLNVKIKSNSNDELGLLASNFEKMCKELKNYINKVYKADIKAKNAELAALQARINPHFLYNTIEAIRMKSNEDGYDEIATMLVTLGKLFRWNIKGKEQIITIRDEIDYITSYVDLQQIRFNGNLDFVTKIDKSMLNAGIPKLLLQPIIENAINHGVAQKKGDRKISIEVYKKEMLIIIVGDNGVGIEEKQLKNIEENFNENKNYKDEYDIGLKNVHQRIQMMFGENYGIEIVSEVDEGTQVFVKIPAMTKKEIENYVYITNS